MTIFDAALKSLFSDANLSVAAMWRVQGTWAPRPVRVILSRPDQSTSFGPGQFVTDSVVLSVRIADCATLDATDTFEIAGELYELIDAPLRDVERLSWTAQARVR